MNEYITNLDKLSLIEKPFNGFKVLDLFAGCGGLALGFEANGFETIGFEMNEDAVLSDQYNFYHEIARLKYKYENLNIINPLPFLKKGENIQSMYYENDPHLNPDGQEVLSKCIVSSLK